MWWALTLIGVCGSGLVLFYLTGKKTGKIEEQLRQKSVLLTAQAQDFRTLSAQMGRWESWRQTVEGKIKAISVSNIPDATLQQLYKDPLLAVEVTDPNSTQLEKSIRPSRDKE